MFKKPLNIKSEQRLSEKEGKKLRERCASEYALSADEVEVLLPRKASLVTQRVGGGSSTRVISRDGLAMLFDVGDGSHLPSLPALWLLMPVAPLPVLLVAQQVEKSAARDLSALRTRGCS